MWGVKLLSWSMAISSCLASPIRYIRLVDWTKSKLRAKLDDWVIDAGRIEISFSVFLLSSLKKYWQPTKGFGLELIWTWSEPVLCAASPLFVASFAILGSLAHGMPQPWKIFCSYELPASLQFALDIFNLLWPIHEEAHPRIVWAPWCNKNLTGRWEMPCNTSPRYSFLTHNCESNTMCIEGGNWGWESFLELGYDPVWQMHLCLDQFGNSSSTTKVAHRTGSESALHHHGGVWIISCQ